MPYRDIAILIGHSKRACEEKARKLGIATRPHFWGKEDEKTLLWLLSQGKTWPQIMVYFPEMSLGAVQVKAQRLKIQDRRKPMSKPKTRLFLMNSAMMPNDGTYRKTTVAPGQARQLWLSWPVGLRKSFLGYPNVGAVAAELFGEAVSLSRDSVEFKKGDQAICFQLKYRVVAPSEKATNKHGEHLEDYNISVVEYT